MPGMSVALYSLFFTLSAFAISANAVPPLISTIAGGISVNASNFGFFMTLQFVSFSLTSFVGGWVKERLKLTNWHLVSAGLIVIVAAFFAGTLLLRSAWSLVLWIVPLGLAGGAVETFSSIEISARSDPGSSKNLCLSQVFYSLGAFAAPQLVYLCFGAGLGWQATFLLFGSFSAAVSLFFVWFGARRGAFRASQPTEGKRLEEGKGRSRVFVFLPARWTLWPALLISSLAIVLVALLLALVDQRVVRYAGVLLLGAAAGPVWPVLVMTTRVTCGSERRTSAVIGLGAIGSATGPLLGSLLLAAGLGAHFFIFELALGVAVLCLCLLALSSCAGARCPGKRRR